MTTNANQSHDTLSDAERRRIRRNLIIYTVGVMTLSVVGGALLASGAQVGALVFLVGPILMAVLLRTLGGDGWKDAGLRLGSLRWYPFALLVFPATLGLILGIGVITGSIVFAGSLGSLAGAALTGLAPWLLYAMFEEEYAQGYRKMLKTSSTILSIWSGINFLLAALILTTLVIFNADL